MGLMRNMRAKNPILRGSNADLLCSMFGGAGELARELGVSHAVVHRWRCVGDRGKAGHIPPSYNLRIYEAADRVGIDREDVAVLLDENVCPTCGREL